MFCPISIQKSKWAEWSKKGFDRRRINVFLLELSPLSATDAMKYVKKSLNNGHIIVCSDIGEPTLALHKVWHGQ